MFTIIGADGREYGPTTEFRVREWIAGGRANLQTRARRNGEDVWRTLGDFPEFSGRPAAPISSGEPPAPPVYAASAAAPGPVEMPALTGDSRTIAQDLIARAAPLDVFDCIAKGWSLWLANFGPLVGVTFLVMAAQFLAGLIPIVNLFAGLLLKGVFAGGLYFYYLGKIRSEPRAVGDAFAGFNRALAPLMLTTLIITGITVAIGMLLAGHVIVSFVPFLMDPKSGFPPVPVGLALVGVLVAATIFVYLSVSWAFAFALVIDQGLSPWTALEVSRRVIGHQWFRVFFLIICAGIVSMLGLIGFVFGVILTIPILYASLMYAYEGICRPPPRIP
ncbi:MAG TPA: hypothetical protein VHD32_07880 [Candidatus Didemnitutus sp.]|nr:hypothetical protein [Candidatus Didemnitutus sp.]